ncbi:MAG TPA: hypothetical protein VFE23_00605 [Usitatibacter sp.]|jgi:hypothetical protein|nr:hypothetical protein [Usitatibacter sp.]
MVDAQALEIGTTYFTIFYADQKLRFPVVETYIYLGRDGPDHVFQTARSFHQRGNWNKMTAADRAEFEVSPLFVLDSESLDPIVDISGLVTEMNDTLERLE